MKQKQDLIQSKYPTINYQSDDLTNLIQRLIEHYDQIQQTNKQFNNLCITAYNQYNKIKSNLKYDLSYSDFIFQNEDSKAKLSAQAYVMLKSHQSLRKIVKKRKNKAQTNLEESINLKINKKRQTCLQIFQFDESLHNLKVIQNKRSLFLLNLEFLILKIQKVLSLLISQKSESLKGILPKIKSAIGLVNDELKSQRIKHAFIQSETLFISAKPIKNQLQNLQDVSEPEQSIKIELIKQILSFSNRNNFARKSHSHQIGKHLESLEQSAKQKSTIKPESSIAVKLEEPQDYLVGPALLTPTPVFYQMGFYQYQIIRLLFQIAAEFLGISFVNDPRDFKLLPLICINIVYELKRKLDKQKFTILKYLN